MSDDSANTTTLEYIRHNFSRVTNEPKKYANVLTFGIDDRVELPATEAIFPNMRLHVSRLPDDYVVDHLPLLNYFYQILADVERTHFDEVWITTSHLSDKHIFLVEVSFE